MPYLKTNRKNKKAGEYKPKVSRRNKQAQAMNAVMDKMMWEAILRDGYKLRD
jgi:hypothetical protein